MPLLQTQVNAVDYTLEVEAEPTFPEVDDTFSVIDINRVIDPEAGNYNQTDIDALIGARFLVTRILGHGMSNTIYAEMIE